MSLATRLQREIKANPAKAVGLGVLLLVAAYFWAPLIVGFIKPAEDSAAAPPPVASAAPAVTTPTAALSATTPPAATVNPVDYDWRKYAKLVDEDAKMRPSAELPGERDPFASPLAASAAETATAAATPEIAAKPITPAEAGLVLMTTLLGAHKKVAEIDGKSYTVGDRVEVYTEAFKTSFRVVEIYPRRVILESHGQRYELKIPRPLLDYVTNAASNQRASYTANPGQESDGAAAEQKTGAQAPGD